MTHLACSGARRLPTIRAPADLARERQTTTNAPIALQHLWAESNKKSIIRDSVSTTKHTTTKASATESKKELLIATESRNTQMGRGGLIKTLLFPHHCAEAVAKIRLSHLRSEVEAEPVVWK